MNYRDILGKILELSTLIDFAQEEYGSNIKEELGDFKVVARKGGSDQGTEWWTVFFFKEHDLYIKFDGYYTSYDGLEDVDTYQVYPKEVSITVYNRKE